MSKLFADTNELKQYGMVNVSYDFNDINPELGIQEELLVIKYIGREQFDILAAGLVANDLDPNELALLDKVRLPLCLIAKANTQFDRYIQESPSGSHVTKTDNKQPASMQAMARRRNETIRRGYNAIDVLISFLQRNKANYPLWVSSDAYLNLKDLFIYTVDQLAQHLPNIESQSQALFLQFVPIMRFQELTIRGRIGKAFFDELKDQVLNDTLTPNNNIVVEEYIRPALAFLSHADAVTKLAHVNPFGIYFFNDLNLDQSASVMKAEPKFLDSISDTYKTNAETKLFDLLAFLNENPDEYPTFRDSPAYTAPEEEPDCPSDEDYSQESTVKIGIF